ncbi:hypothetical protein GCM10027290_04080 [Micromonospora sonneratiae]|uniref:Manganese transporter n=1 Tax=Micromonospora sonneratiae TaxID=1184706 RepID=A0ABW3YK53_9ACTN
MANAISQDGDALILLAALRRRAAATATVIATIPVILVGLALLAFMGGEGIMRIQPPTETAAPFPARRAISSHYTGYGGNSPHSPP